MQEAVRKSPQSKNLCQQSHLKINNWSVTISTKFEQLFHIIKLPMNVSTNLQNVAGDLKKKFICFICLNKWKYCIYVRCIRIMSFKWYWCWSRALQLQEKLLYQNKEVKGKSTWSSWEESSTTAFKVAATTGGLSYPHKWRRSNGLRY